MGRATFGGSADYSSLFASLYGSLGAAEGGTAGSTAAEAANLRYQFEAGQLDATGYAAALRALAATGDQTSTNHFNLLTTAVNAEQDAQKQADATAKQAAADAQAAADQSASDQWANGEMSDQAWLAYVGQRAATATDAQDKAQWQGYLLKYTDQIGVNTAEGAFKTGGSINDLILFYQQKLASEPSHNTQEYRDTQSRLNDLQDQRSSTSVQDGANAISAKIDKGAATYQDLIKFYKQQLPSLRPGSDLAKQLQGEIAKVQTTIDTNAKAGELEKLQYDYNRGAITGATFARGIRSAAAEFQKTVPQKYYQMLELAVALDKNPGLIGAAGRASASGGAASKNKTLAATVDQLQGQRDNLLALVNQADGGQKTGYDAVSGKTVTFTSKLVDQYDAQILDTYKALSAAHEAKGDHSAAQADMASMSKYITQGAGGSTIGIIGHNTAKTEDTYTNLVLSTVKELQGNVNSADPKPSVVADVAAKWARFAKSLEYTATKITTFGGPQAEAVTTGGAAKTQLQSVDVGYLARVKAITGALQVQANPGSTPDQQQAASDALATAFGADPAFPDSSAGSKAFQNISKNLVDPAYQISASARGLADGTVARVVDSSGNLGYFPVAPQSPTDIADGVPPQPILGSGVLNTSKQQKLIQIVIDINGRPTTVSAVASLASSNQQVWVYADKDSKALGINKGDVLTNDQVDALDKQFPGWRKNGTATLAPAMSYYSVQTPTWVDSIGVSHASETWVQDTGTNQWYKDKLPIRGVQYRPDGTVQVTKGAEGPQLLMDFSSFADASGVPAPYVGENPKKVGDLIGAPNGLRVAGLAGRDINGYVTDAPTSNPAFAYYDPTNPFVKDNWWQTDERQQRSNDAKARAGMRSSTSMPVQSSLGAPGKTVGGGPGGESVGINVGSIVDGLMSFAKSLGVNLGSGSAPALTPAKPTATRGTAQVAIPAASAPATIGRPGRTVGGGPGGESYSGPAVSPQIAFAPPALKTTSSAVPKISAPHQVVPVAPATSVSPVLKRVMAAPATIGRPGRTVGGGPGGESYSGPPTSRSAGR